MYYLCGLHAANMYTIHWQPVRVNLPTWLLPTWLPFSRELAVCLTSRGLGRHRAGVQARRNGEGGITPWKISLWNGRSYNTCRITPRCLASYGAAHGVVCSAACGAVHGISCGAVACHGGVCKKTAMAAVALHSGSGNCSPAPDVVF